MALNFYYQGALQPYHGDVMFSFVERSSTLRDSNLRLDAVHLYSSKYEIVQSFENYYQHSNVLFRLGNLIWEVYFHQLDMSFKSSKLKDVFHL